MPAVDVDVALARAAAGSLLDNALHRPVGVPPAALPDLLAGADRHRISGLLADAFAQRYLLGDDATIEAVSQLHLAALRTSLRCEAAAVAVVETLSGAGLDSRVLKGIALAHLDYGDPAWRVFGDADILVRRRDLPAALTALHAAGFGRDTPPVRGWWERRYGKAVVLHDHAGVEVDLHLTIAGGYYGLAIPSDALFDIGSETFEVAGVTITALPRPCRLVHAAYHAILGGGSGLRTLRDVAQLARDTATLDAARALARGWGGEAVLAAAIHRAWTALSLDPHHPAFAWADRVDVSTDEARRMASSTASPSDGWAGEGREGGAALGVLDRAAFVAGLAFPSRASLAARHRTRWQHLRRVATQGRS